MTKETKTTRKEGEERLGKEDHIKGYGKGHTRKQGEDREGGKHLREHIT